MKTLYTTSAVATGDGRNGRVHLPRRPPRHPLSGRRRSSAEPDEATNPEQLFAAGYAACFHSALKLVADEGRSADTSDSEVVADVSLGALPRPAASGSPRQIGSRCPSWGPRRPRRRW